MRKHLKKILIALACLVVVVIAVSFIYAKFWNKAQKEFDTKEVKDRLTTTVAPEPTGNTPADSAPTGTDAVTTVPNGTTAPAGAGVDGNWAIADGSEVGYRVDESINGFDTTANGRTKSVTGQFTIDGTTVAAGEFTVDMPPFKSDESRRAGQFNGRIMSVDQFPTATFALTAPIDFQQVPTDGTTITASATGDLTLHGVTKSVTFDVEATFQNGRVGVTGQIPVIFADFGIPNPSFATVTTEDHGILEFLLIFDRA